MEKHFIFVGSKTCEAIVLNILLCGLVTEENECMQLFINLSRIVSHKTSRSTKNYERGPTNFKHAIIRSGKTTS